MDKITTNDFDQLLKDNEMVVVDFFATWCGPCKMYAPIVEKLASECPNIKVVKVDVDEEGELAMRFAISSIPTTLVFKESKLIAKEIGYRSLDQLKSLIQ